MLPIGVIFVLAGAGLTLFGLTYETSVASGMGRIENIGLRANQTIYVTVGGFLFLSGVVCLCSSAIVDAVKQIQPPVHGRGGDTDAGGQPDHQEIAEVPNADHPNHKVPYWLKR